MEETMDDLMDAAAFRSREQLKDVENKLSFGESLAKTLARVKDHKGRNAFSIAACVGNVDMCKYLIEEIKLDVHLKDGNGCTPLHAAIFIENLPMIKYFFEAGADVSSGDLKKKTPLHHAAARGNLEVLELLVSQGADVNSTSDYGAPLHMAIGNKRDGAVKFLLRHNANPNHHSHNLTPLFYAVKEKSKKLVVLLLEAGADPNIDGIMMPLSQAVVDRQIELVPYLLEYGADPNAVGPDGITALEYAALNTDTHCMVMLFPVTSPIQYFPDWSISGILKHINSKEAKAQREMRKKAGAQISKSKGKEAFLKGQYLNATFWYTMAIEGEPSDETLYFDRLQCWFWLEGYDEALTDAKICIRLKPDWPEAHYWEGFVMLMRSLKYNAEILKGCRGICESCTSRSV